MADDPYAAAASSGGLKLKGIGSVGKKKKKGKKKSKEALVDAAVAAGAASGGQKKKKEELGEALTAEYEDTRTEAQKKFDRIQAEREAAKIKKMASKSHKEKVDALNNYLATLSEHYDIPKIKVEGREFKDVRAVKRELTRLHRQLIDEEDETQLLFLFRETKRLKQVLEVMVGIESETDTDAVPAASAGGENADGSQVDEFKEREERLQRPSISAEGMLIRSMYLPADFPATDKGEAKNGAEGDSGFTNPALLPPPTEFTDMDPLADLDESALTRFNSKHEGEDGEADFFVCCQCLNEDYGDIDERDGNFYCFDCWNEYQGLGEETLPPEDDLRQPRRSIDDPTHPDYWSNLKRMASTMNRVEGTGSMRYWKPPPGTEALSKSDVFAHFGLAEETENPQGSDHSSGDAIDAKSNQRNENSDAVFDSKAKEVNNLDVVVDAMLMRIQDKRKSMRYIKPPGGDSQGPAATGGKRFAKARKAKKKKIDPKKLYDTGSPKPPPKHFKPEQQGLLIQSPIAAIPIRSPKQKKRKPPKPMREVQLFGVVSPDGTVSRLVYRYDDFLGDPTVEKVCKAEDEWDEKGLPVRSDIANFILDEFGGCVDSNVLGGPPPIAPPDY